MTPIQLYAIEHAKARASAIPTERMAKIKGSFRLLMTVNK